MSGLRNLLPTYRDSYTASVLSRVLSLTAKPEMNQPTGSTALRRYVQGS